jgi:hypothetical protein
MDIQPSASACAHCASHAARPNSIYCGEPCRVAAKQQRHRRRHATVPAYEEAVVNAIHDGGVSPSRGILWVLYPEKMAQAWRESQVA